MKRYEKMSKEEIIDFLSTELNCNTCTVRTCLKNAINGLQCVYIKKKWLNGEPKARIATINSAEDLDNAIHNFNEFCDENPCTGCPYGNYNSNRFTGCFIKYLKEEI